MDEDVVNEVVAELRERIAALEARLEAAERKAALADEARPIIDAATVTPTWNRWRDDWCNRYDALSTPTGARNEGNDE